MTIPSAPSPAQLEAFRLKAAAEVERRKREGIWSGAVHAHVAYQKKPIEWIVEHLAVPEATIRWSMAEEYQGHEWDGTPDPLASACEALAASRDTGIESATGTGKTFLAACIVFWFLACFENSLVVSAAPKQDQLLLNLWKEIGALWPRFQKHFPDAELLTGKIRMRPGESDKETWSAIAFVCGVGADEDAATKAQGFHREHLLIITEETPGIHPAIMTAFANTRTDDHNLHLALGNPDHRNDPLHRFCFDEKGQSKPGVQHIRISALDHPNVVTGRSVVPGAIGKRRLEERTNEYGRGSRLFLSRVRGISPAESQEALIRWEWCVAAAARYEDPAFRAGSHAIGADVANSEDGDKAAIARWQGACLTEVESMACPNANEFGARLVREIRADGLDPRYCGIDPVGVGAGAVNEMKRLGLRIRWLGGAMKAIPGLDVDVLWSETQDVDGKTRPAGPHVIEAERFGCLRDQIWWRMREDLRLGRIALPPDEELWTDLTTPEFGTQNGKIWVESKEDIVKRLRRSPDKGDAACYGNWVRRRTPVPSAPAESPVGSRNRDVRLEHYLHKKAKQDAAEERRVKRALARNNKGRKRA